MDGRIIDPLDGPFRKIDALIGEQEDFGGGGLLRLQFLDTGVLEFLVVIRGHAHSGTAPTLAANGSITRNSISALRYINGKETALFTRRNAIRGMLCLPFCGPSLLQAANVKLYLKDGSFQLVREYKNLGDRVRYYSVERGDFEEIPTDLIDLKKTEAEMKQREESFKEEAKAQDEEDKAERTARREIAQIPQDSGVYLITGTTLKAMKAADPKVVNNKGRHLLKLASPIPLITDKSWLELDGLHSGTVINDPRPEFYIRLAAEERFGIVRMGEHKKNRVVEKLTILPVVKEVVEEPDLVDVFRRQVAEGVYKVWAEKAMAPGEYAVVEYTESKVNMQVWDFGISATAVPAREEERRPL